MTKTNKMTCALSEDSDQPGHPPSLISAFTVHSKDSQGPKVSSCGQRRLCSDLTDVQVNLSLRTCNSVGIIVRRLNW